MLLVSYFEVQPDLMKTEGLFRIAASLDKLDELQVHVTMGNYYYLTLLKEEPHVVSNYLKKVLKYMGEPLCTFALYSRFRDLSDTPVPKRAAKLKEICAPATPGQSECLHLHHQVLPQSDQVERAQQNERAQPCHGCDPEPFQAL